MRRPSRTRDWRRAYWVTVSVLAVWVVAVWVVDGVTWSLWATVLWSPLRSTDWVKEPQLPPAKAGAAATIKKPAATAANVFFMIKVSHSLPDHAILDPHTSAVNPRNRDNQGNRI